jgi:succinoglycan biosynthesis transport protein ExoP
MLTQRWRGARRAWLEMEATEKFDSPQRAGLGIKPLASLLAHRRLAAWAFVFIVLAGSPLAWIKGAPRYVATATLQIAPRYMKNVKDDSELEFQSNSQYRQFVEHQVRSVIRFDVVRSDLLALGAKACPFRLAGETASRPV